jgi:predicted DNA-binding transcriptional regulator AlpA
MDKDAYDVIEFCHRHAISRSAFYNSLKAGTGPRIMRVGARVLISKEAAEAWRREREQVGEQPQAAATAARAFGKLKTTADSEVTA